MRAYTETVEVYDAPEVEGTYTTKKDWNNPVLVLKSVASVQPDRMFESRSPERDTAQERLDVYMPYTELVKSTHRVKVRGNWYEVEGPPNLWPRGRTRHTHFRIWRAMH